MVIVDIAVDSFLEMIEFFTTLILNADEVIYLWSVDLHNILNKEIIFSWNHGIIEQLF